MNPPDPTPAQDVLIEHQASLRRLARSLVTDEHLAEDLVQDSALVALRRPPQAAVSMRAWVARVARSLATNATRDRRVRSERELDAFVRSAPPTPEEVAQQIEVQERVLAALAQLEEPYKSTLFQRYWDDVPPSVIAARTGVPVSTVKTRLARGLMRMRAELDARHGGERGAWAITLAGGLEGWERMALDAAAAAGGVAMGVKLALAAAMVGGGVILGTWWALRPPAEPHAREVVHSQPAGDELAVVGPAAPRKPTSEPRIKMPPKTPAVRQAMAQEPEGPAWLLELELRGWEPADAEPLSIVVSGPREDSPSVTLARPFADRLSVDVGQLFSGVEERPDHLRVRLDHPQYLPLEAGVLVQEELWQPETEAGVMQISLRLVRAQAVVTGTVAVEAGGMSERLRVALFAMDGEQPAYEPVDTARLGPDGTFRLRADAANEHAVVAYLDPEGDGQPRGLRPETRVVALPRNGVLDLDPIVLGKGATIAGRVSFPSNAEPSAGRVQILLQATDTRRLPSGRLARRFPPLAWKDGRFETGEVHADWDTAGRFRVSGLAPSRHRIVPALHWIQAEVPTLRLQDLAAEQKVTAPSFDLLIVMNIVGVAFVVKSDGIPASRASFKVVTREDENGTSWRGSQTDEQGRIFVILDPSGGMHCKVDDRVHAPNELRFSRAELLSGGPIEIALNEPMSETATLGIRLGLVARDLAEDLLLDVRLYDRSDPTAMSFLRNGVFSMAGTHAQAHAVHQSLQPEMLIEPDRTQVVSRLRPASYVVLLSPRSADPSRPCLLLPDEFEVELLAGGRVDHEWHPEVGGALRINFIGTSANGASLLDGNDEQLDLNYRTETSTSSSPTIPGVNDVKQALSAGSYRLHIRMKDGTTRIVQVHVEAGRVNDVEIDLDSL